MSTAALTFPPRTETLVMQEMAEAVVRLTMLELELKRIRNPNGLTLADLRGILSMDVSDDKAGPAHALTETTAGRSGEPD